MEGETVEKEIVVERRYAILQVSPEFLISMFVGTSIKRIFVEEHALPLDARIVGVGPMNLARQTHIFDASHGVVGILIQSESFEDIAPGLPLPILSPPKFKVIEEGVSQRSLETKCPKCGQFSIILDESLPGHRCIEPDCDWKKVAK